MPIREARYDDGCRGRGRGPVRPVGRYGMS